RRTEGTRLGRSSSRASPAKLLDRAPVGEGRAPASPARGSPGSSGVNQQDYWTLGRIARRPLRRAPGLRPRDSTEAVAFALRRTNKHRSKAMTTLRWKILSCSPWAASAVLLAGTAFAEPAEDTAAQDERKIHLVGPTPAVSHGDTRTYHR